MVRDLGNGKGEENYKTGNTTTGREKTKQVYGGEQLFENRIEREWLTTEQAAEFLAITQNALRIMVHREQVPTFRLGRRLRFKRRDCEALFERKGA